MTVLGFAAIVVVPLFMPELVSGVRKAARDLARALSRVRTPAFRTRLLSQWKELGLLQSQARWCHEIERRINES
jgi:hypothetical protein